MAAGRGLPAAASQLQVARAGIKQLVFMCNSLVNQPQRIKHETWSWRTVWALSKQR